MAYPDPPIISYSYTGFSQSLGDGSFPGPQIDNDFANLVASLDEVTAFLQVPFRSDGVLKISALPVGADFQAYLDVAEANAIAAAASAGVATEQAGFATDAAEAAEQFKVAAGASATAAEEWALAAKAEAESIDVSEFSKKAANLSDLASAAAARTNLGLGSLALLNSVDLANLAAAVVAKLVPVGAVQAFVGVTAPTGWTKANGATIGSSASGAGLTGDAYRALFDVLWATPGLTITTSTGGATTRGASAAADWSANKRIATPDLRGEFVRGWDDGRSVDAGRVAGSAQGDLVKAHIHEVSVTGTAASAGAHTHDTATVTGTGGTTVGVSETEEGDAAGAAVTSSSAGAHTHSVTATGTAAANTGAENRPRNVALLHCIKL